MWVWVANIYKSAKSTRHDLHSYGQTYPLFYFFSIHPEISRSAVLYDGISSGFAYITYTNILLPSINLLPPNSHPRSRPGLCQTTMFQELLEAVSNLGFFENLPKENLKIAYGFVEDLEALLLVKQVMMDDGWCMMDEWWMMDDGWWMMMMMMMMMMMIWWWWWLWWWWWWWMMDENPPNFRQCFLASWTLGPVFRGPEPTMLALHKDITPAHPRSKANLEPKKREPFLNGDEVRINHILDFSVPSKMQDASIHWYREQCGWLLQSLAKQKWYDLH